MNGKICNIAKKELSAYFSSPVAFIFLGTFLVVNLFIFFWVESFFARNIADVRPLFDWMPLLMVFLVAALTMRMWSEERRSGTLEFLLTLPVDMLQLVMGKFVGGMILVLISLALTLPIPFTVSFFGDLDWGPIIGAYLATIFLAGAYLSIGLFVSVRSDNQIVSLIVTTLVCLLFYLVGSDALTAFLGNQGAEIARLLGTGSRFDSITRGVLDIRDIYYYLSLMGVFLSLNVFYLQKLTWSPEAERPTHGRWRMITLLLVVNFIVGNIWLQQVNTARADLTRGSVYSISPATKAILGQLQEPLLIRGYFSSKTHPLLAPLVPRLRDLIREYEIVGGGKVRSEFVDPREDPELEEEASRKYNIKPVPFQISDRHQASLVNSYFDILVQYGDQFEVLSFRELIEVQVRGEMDLDVKLRNPEYDITRAIKKALFGFKSIGHLFAGMPKPVKFVGYISDDSKLPAGLSEFRPEVEKTLEELREESEGKLEVSYIDPQAGDGAVAKEIAERFGFRPMVTGLFDPNQFYFYMTLQGDDQVIQVALPENMTAEGLRQGMEAALKRFSPGFVRNISLATPPQKQSNPYMAQMGMDGGSKRFQLLRQKLSESYQVQSANLSKGTVSDSTDLLVLAAPDNLSEKELFAIDQFLSRGGTVVMATAPISVSRTRNSLSGSEHKSGLSDWLKHHGITLGNRPILDQQSDVYPVPVRRRLGGFTVEELKMVQYPFFIDIRDDGLNRDNSITSGVPQVTVNWAVPIEVDQEQNKGRKVVELLKSSENSWLADSLKLEPDPALQASQGFLRSGEPKSRPIAVMIEGTFESYFKGKQSPLLEEQPKEETPPGAEEAEKSEKEEEKPEVIASVIEKSPSSARLIIFASNEFLEDTTLQISASTGTGKFLHALELVENSIDWSLEDRALLTIRGRGQFARTLRPMERGQQALWEYVNYGLALIGLLLVYGTYVWLRSQALNRQRQLLGA